MQPNLIERIVADERAVPFQANDPFTHTYFEFLGYSQNIDHIERHHLIIGANFTYGWMPTMLKFKHVQYEPVADLLNQAKHGVQLTNPDLAAIAALINNSLVGTSKLLHFVNPHVYAIWDSRVYRYLFGEKSQYHLHTPSVSRYDSCMARTVQGRGVRLSSTVGPPSQLHVLFLPRTFFATQQA